MRKNLFISTGYFSTLTAGLVAFCLPQQKRKNYLVIIVSKEFSWNNEIQQEINNQIFFAKKVAKWHKIIAIKEEDFPLSTYNYNNYNDIIVKSLGTNNFFEVYVSSLNIADKLNRIISFKRISIIDEGIGTYLQIKEYGDLSKFHTFYNFLPVALASKNIHNVSIPKNLLYKKLHKLNKIYKTPSINFKTYIIAISSFYFIKNEKKQLIHTYKEYINNLSQKNIEVKIKLHPRNSLDDFIDFKDKILDTNLPLLDMYLLKNKKYIEGLYSMGSSILFMSKYIYKIPTTFISDEVQDDYTKKINEFYTKYIK
ncbi:MAG: alpha-2,8-polysialyltransferase family protein [Alphaproteobacteria bacterium]|jgi:hypothetical protein|nr:alpha-2,8-polysialyltransferase family protein [Alphaproteobacteria bacterium]